MKQIILPEDAPFSPEQKEWLNGYLTALLAPYEGEDKVPGIPVTIAWGSQTGTSETMAKKFSKLAAKSGVEPTVVDLSAFDHASLSELEHLIIITSTYGEGEPPDNAQAFHDFIHGDNAPKLEKLNYAVLSLGDSSYPDFCQCGIEFDEKLKELGGTQLIPRVDLDVDYDDDYAQWTADILAIFGSAAAAADDDYEESGVTKKNPYTAEILKLENLNADESARETTHVEIDLKDSGVSYEAGDALGVFPINDADLVQRLIEALGFDEALKPALTEEYEIRNITLPLVKAWAEKSGSEALLELTTSDDRTALNDYLWGREIIDLMIEHPIEFADADEFLGMLKPLAPRLYSIASSPKAHPDEVHLTVGVVKYESEGFVRKGVCSTYFSERSDLAKPRVFVHENKAFRPPEDPTVPMIMVGPGTGIAPFRAFLEEREATEATGKNWLFFGNPHEKLDYLYQEQLEGMAEKGYLEKVSLAFSRDQEEKIYVQDKMIEEGETLYQWLEEGGHFYVCGDASRMAKDVDSALHKVVEKYGGKTEEESVAYIAELKSSKRYARDVY